MVGQGDRDTGDPERHGVGMGAADRVASGGGGKLMTGLIHFLSSEEKETICEKAL
ncbi:hypothetical protein HAP94_20885 [Acidithiobacillus ferrivorans]|nr:hypothetical protein [Acidithiobacillus ferrivorans]